MTSCGFCFASRCRSTSWGQEGACSLHLSSALKAPHLLGRSPGSFLSTQRAWQHSPVQRSGPAPSLQLGNEAGEMQGLTL